MVLQINGKIKAKIMSAVGLEREEVFENAKNTPDFSKHLDGKEIIKVIYVKDKLLNVVVKNV